MKKARPKKKVIKKRVVKKKVVRKKPIRKKKVIRKKRVMKKKKPIKKKVVKKRKIVKKRKPVRRVKKRAVKKKKVIKRKPRKKKIIKKKRVVRRKRRKKSRIPRRTYSVGSSLEQLFESPSKVQAMKLFFRNPEESFLLKEAAKIMRINLAMLRREIKRLEKIGLLNVKRISPRRELFSINPNFDFFNELRDLVLKVSPVSKDKMLKAIKGLGKIKVVLLSGLFIGNDTARADLLIVGDNINQRKLAGFIKNLEAEAGTDVNCVVMTTEEFNYRYDMYDRFLRDLLSEKGEFLINRLNI